VRRIDDIVIHHSASPLSTTAADIEGWHTLPKKKGGNGWKRIGYHLICESDGSWVRGRFIGKPGAHCPPNAHSIGICLVGNNTKSGEEWRWAQIDALKEMLKFLGLLFPDAVARGHRDMPGTATECPGLDVRELLRLEETP
jgi:N-acetylmuramoyl-L-alanine amidase